VHYLLIIHFVYRLADGREVTLQEEVPITSISLSPDSCFLLTALQVSLLVTIIRSCEGVLVTVHFAKKLKKLCSLLGATVEACTEL